MEWQANSQKAAWLQDRQWELSKQPGRLYRSLDGVTAPLIGEWRELKNIAWYRVDSLPFFIRQVYSKLRKVS